MDKEISVNPNYKISFGTAIARFWKGYFKFSGRATRAEFGWAILFLLICSAVVWPIPYILSVHMSYTDTLVFGLGSYIIWAAVTFFPSWALWIRRGHDRNDSGVRAFLGLIFPVLNFFFLLEYLFGDSQKGKNDFGDSEKYPEDPVPEKITEKAETAVPVTNGTTKFCPHCGNKVSKDVAFCPHCGGKQPQL